MPRPDDQAGTAAAPRGRAWRIPGGGLLLATMLVLTSCHDADKYVFSSEDGTAVDRLFTLTAADTTLPGDGFSSMSVLARVADVSEKGRQVLFITTAGDLRVGSSVVGDTAVVATSPQGEAPVELLSARLAATARVAAVILGVEPQLRREISVRFTPVRTEDVIAFIGSPDSVLADGESIVVLQVQIASGLQGSDRMVVFETTRGTLLLSAGTGTTRIVEADDDGIATARLKSPVDAGDAVVTATVKGFRQETSVRFVSVPAIQFVDAPATAPADGATLTRLSVEVEEGSTGQNREVSFETTDGIFTSSNARRAVATVGADNTATVFLRSPEVVADAIVTASLQGITEEHAIRFQVAPPDSIIVLIEPGKANLSASDQIRIDAEFTREPGRGTVTRDLNVLFTAVDSLGGAIPRSVFINVTRTDENGFASAVFLPDSTAYRGPVMVRVRPADFNTGVEGVAFFRIVD